MPRSKPFKVQNAEQSKRLGIVASSLQNLVEKAKQKLGIASTVPLRVVLEEDGTEVDDEDYFQRLPPQTVFVILLDGEEWSGYVSTLRSTTEKIIQNVTKHEELMNQISEFIHGTECEKMYQVLSEMISCLQSNIEAEHRDDDEDWFDGINRSYKRKEDVMKNSAQSRIRNYLSKTKEALEQDERKSVQKLLEKFTSELKKYGYYGDYFVRSSDSKDRLCNEHGWFRCEGPFNKKSCESFHGINPYSNKESRIMFSTWNLDHRIEKSREVLPELLSAVRNCPKGSEVNWRYFFDLLFTRKNLKLVHIGCHKKDTHTGYKCEKRKIFVKLK